MSKWIEGRSHCCNAVVFYECKDRATDDYSAPLHHDCLLHDLSPASPGDYPACPACGSNSPIPTAVKVESSEVEAMLDNAMKIAGR